MERGSMTPEKQLWTPEDVAEKMDTILGRVEAMLQQKNNDPEVEEIVKKMIAAAETLARDLRQADMKEAV